MSDAVTVEGMEYISSKRAARESGYAQDYIGQLARGGQIEARRIGGLWYVSIDSLQGYKRVADTYKPEPPPRHEVQEADSLISFDGKDYISASRAAGITGYHQDYVGQLARAGTILARQVGNRWYVEREGIISHKAAKDALLAAVQAESVGIVRNDESVVVATTVPEELPPVMRYSAEKAELLPGVANTQEDEAEEQNAVPIRVVRSDEPEDPYYVYEAPTLENSRHWELSGRNLMIGGAVTAAIMVIGIGIYAGAPFLLPRASNAALSGAAGAAQRSAAPAGYLDQIGAFLETLVTRDLVYRRSDDFTNTTQ